MAVIALIILLSDPTCNLQAEKAGFHGREFTMYKFRSMVVNAEEILRKDKSLYDRYVSKQLSPDEDEDPVTRIGRFLRNTSLDELPQFLMYSGGR